ncbi:MAG: hypothetical protein IKF80_04905 [Erysipelotrichaceae bacterium]|nr:hypothetical protein [Erysipelotrichaceae bacterium]
MTLEELEAYQKRFHKRYLVKKMVTILFSVLIVYCGVSGVLYSALVFKNNIIDRMRYMTFDGTMYTTLISFIFIIISIYEAYYDTEVTNRFVYFMRLSSATTEFIIFIVVMAGLTPFVTDTPDISSFPGIMMHLVIPMASILCFIFNDAPIGKVNAYEPLFGSTFITIYAVIMAFLFLTRILPSSLAPYSFLDFEHNSIFFGLACLAGIYIVAYFIAKAFIKLNGYYSWVWYKDLMNKKKRIQKDPKKDLSAQDKPDPTSSK